MRLDKDITRANISILTTTKISDNFAHLMLDHDAETLIRLYKSQHPKLRRSTISKKIYIS